MKKKMFWGRIYKKVLSMIFLCFAISTLFQNYSYGQHNKVLKKGKIMEASVISGENNKASEENNNLIYYHTVIPIAALSILIIVLIFDRNKHRHIIQKLKSQDEYIEHMINYDDLTNLPNNKLFIKTLAKEIQDEHCGSILLLDVDNYNSIKDTLGHEYGDSLLKEIALRLSSIDNKKLYVSRMEADKFTILIFEEDQEEVIEQYIEKVHKALRRSLIIDSHENFISVSMGVTCFPKNGMNPGRLLANADTAMYKVKHSGKNNYMFFNEDMLREIKNRADIVAMLCNALKTDGFRLVYQPQVNTLTGEITGFEALLRLKNNNITPDAFIPVAEETGLIIEIGRWVAREAIEQLARWRKNAYPLKPVAINYSNRQLQDDGFNSFIMDSLKANDIDPKYLEIEITESILLNKNGNAMQFLNSIKDMGIHLTLDDFGSGFSSISYLTFLPIYKIKIDKMICVKFLEVESDKVINDMISMLHSLGLEITAEGIEHIEQYQKLKQVGCDYIQGFLFCRPVAVDEIEKIYQYNMLTRLEKKD